MLHHILWVAFDFEKILWCQALQGVPVDISPLLGLCLLKTASVRVYWDGIRCGWWCQYTLNDFELWDGIIVIILLIAQNCICWSLSLIWLLLRFDYDCDYFGDSAKLCLSMTGRVSSGNLCIAQRHKVIPIIVVIIITIIITITNSHPPYSHQVSSPSSSPSPSSSRRPPTWPIHDAYDLHLASNNTKFSKIQCYVAK